MGAVPKQCNATITEYPNLTIPSPNESAHIECRNISSFFNGSDMKSDEVILHVEHVELYTNVTIPFRGRLSIDLFSPMGTSSRMLEFREYDNSTGGIDFTFMTIRNWCENPKGNWIVQYCNHDASE